MRSPLQRLYETKLLFLASSFTVIGIALLVVSHVLDGSQSWLVDLPLTDLGSALFTTGLVVIAFEYLDGRDGEARAARRLRRILREQAPAMRDAVIAGFAFDASDLARVSSPAVLDQVTRNALAIQLGDPELANEVYDDLRTQVLGPGERRYDLRVRIELQMSTATPTPLFEVTARWEYTTRLDPGVRRFVCVSDLKEYRELLQEPARTSAWHFTPVDDLTAGSPEAFQLTRFSINEAEQPIRRSLAKDGCSQIYAVSPHLTERAVGQPVRVAYTYRTLVRQDGHLLHLALGQPTRDVDIQLSYRGCGIRKLRVLDFIASGRKTVVATELPAPEDEVATVSFEGWALPRSGVAFVWMLDGASG